MFRKYFVVKTGVCGALFLGVCALTAGSLMQPDAPAAVAQANHKTPTVEANYSAADMIPFTQQNDITEHTTAKYKCSGGQEVTLDSVNTSDANSNGMPQLGFYDFLTVTQNGFVIAKNEVQTNRYEESSVMSLDYNGKYVSKASAGGNNAKGEEVVFTFFSVLDSEAKSTSYTLIAQTLSKDDVDEKYTCEVVK